MATTTETPGPTIKEVNGTGAGTGNGVEAHRDRDVIEKETPLTHTATNISLSPELFEKVGQMALKS